MSDTNPAVHPRGSFGNTPLVSLTHHGWVARNYEEPFMGLSPAGQHIWGSLVIDGRRIVPIRQIQNELAVRMLLFAGEEGQDLALTRPARVFTGIGDLGERDGLWGMREPGRPDGFCFAAGGSQLSWREPGVAAVTGEALGHAVQFAIPDADEPFAYQARFFTVSDPDSGSVIGAVGHEQVYMRPGRGWFSSTYMQDLEQCWIVFVTVFADGSIAHGHLLVGGRGFNLAAIQESDRPSSVTSDIGCAAIDYDDAGFPNRVVFAVGGDAGTRWLYRSNGPGGRMSLGGRGPRWREGVVTRDGDDREVVFSHAWAEVARDVDCVQNG